MINHARTLLLNENEPKLQIPGEELIPEEFAPLRLPTFLKIIRSVLFGASPDRLMLNYRLREILTLLHASELGEFVLDLDSRITYATSGRSELFDFPSFIIESYAGLRFPNIEQDQVVLSTMGDLPPSDESGGTDFQWLVIVMGLSATREERAWYVEQRRPGGRRMTTEGIVCVPHPKSLSAPVSLSGDGRAPFVRLFSPNDFVHMAVYYTTSFLVTAAQRPSKTLAELEAQLRTLGEATLLPLFNVGSTLGGQEPWQTFYRLWTKHPEFPYRMGGLLLALIYQTEQLRHG